MVFSWARRASLVDFITYMDTSPIKICTHTHTQRQREIPEREEIQKDLEMGYEQKETHTDRGKRKHKVRHPITEQRNILPPSGLCT